MQNCLVMSLLVGLLFVYGCASPTESGPDAPDSTSPERPTAGGDAAPAGSTPGSGAEGAGSASAGKAPTEVTSPTTEGSTAGPATTGATPEEPGGDQVAGAAPAGAAPDSAAPVNASATETAAVSTVSKAALLAPELATETAPEIFQVRFTTTKGDFTVEAHRQWAPNGVDRLYNLVKIGFFTDVAFFRVMKNFVVQFGMHGDPEVNAAWFEATIDDDDVKQSNTRGFVSFADRRTPDSRTTQLFINLASMNSYLDEDGYAPVGRVIEGMDVVDSLYSGYGEGAPRGRGPNQALIQTQGNEYLRREFPELDYIRSAAIVE